MSRETQRERERRKRAANIRAGLTAKGQPRKPRYRPKPHQNLTIGRSSSTQPEQAKRPHMPLNVIKRPPKLPKVEPLTDEDREAA